MPTEKLTLLLMKWLLYKRWLQQCVSNSTNSFNDPLDLKTNVKRE